MKNFFSKHKLIIFIMLAVVASILLNASPRSEGEQDEPTFTRSEEKAALVLEAEKAARDRTYLVSYELKYRGGAERAGTQRVTTAWYATEGQAFLDAVIRDLKDSGVIPQETTFDDPAAVFFRILSIDPIPADIILSTADPAYSEPPSSE